MIGFPNQAMARKQTDYYQLKVLLLDVKPQVWRRVHVAPNIYLNELHLVLQAALGWTNSHLHSFKFGEHEYSLSYEPGALTDLKMIDERGVALSSLIGEPGETFGYSYDFGDDWQHIVTFEHKGDREPRVAYPRCIDGQGACPPEDCGGTHGFSKLKRILKKPTHKEYKVYMEWIGYPYDADFSNFQKDLRKLREGALMDALGL
jgi:hypothetical protein